MIIEKLMRLVNTSSEVFGVSNEEKSFMIYSVVYIRYLYLKLLNITIFRIDYYFIAKGK